MCGQHCFDVLVLHVLCAPGLHKPVVPVDIPVQMDLPVPVDLLVQVPKLQFSVRGIACSGTNTNGT